MQAVRFNAFQQFPVLEEVPSPSPGPGEVLLKVAGAGACHSDVAIFADFTVDTAPPGLAPPYTLGHESSGWVEEVGPGVTGFEAGEAYLVYGPVGCGRCAACSRGQDTYCAHAATNPYPGIGLGRDGGMAEYMTAPAHHLVPLGDADPVDAAPLADAALTPYHAIKLALPALAKGGASALVVGLGGLGMTAVQILRALTGATVIATDVKDDAMRRAEALGALTVPPGPDQVEAIRDLTGGRGVDASFDFVAATATLATAHGSLGLQSRMTVVGIAPGTLTWSFFGNPYEATITNTYWGTVEDLHEVVAMYRAGQIVPEVERYSLPEALEAYRRLEQGQVTGRAVVVPHG